jgi:ribonuclease R
VAIADVSHYVAPGSLLDREAELRGNSVYFPQRAVHMLPEQLATDVCSLKPDVDRLAVVVILDYDRQVAEALPPGQIRNRPPHLPAGNAC